MLWGRVKVVFFILGVTFVLVELGVRFLPFFSSPSSNFFQVEVFKSTEELSWYSEWRREERSLQRRFITYDIYRLFPFSGKWIEVLSSGARGLGRVEGKGKGGEVWLLGGSTVWGSFSRDAFTIAGYLQKLWPEVRVVNQAEIGFVLSQEFMRVLRLVEGGVLPRMVVFIDGVNDFMAAIHNWMHYVKVPWGKPWEFEKYHYLFQLGKTGEVGWRDIFRKSKLVRLFLDRFGGSKEKRVRFPSSSDLERIKQGVVEDYRKRVERINLLLRALGIKPVFVLQPLLVFKKDKTAEEVRAIEKNWQWYFVLEEGFLEIASYQRWFLNRGVRFYSLHDLFELREGRLFSDIIHYSELGNRLIAKALYSFLVSEFGR